MAIQRTADVVFCLDATASMRAVYDSVAAYVERLYRSDRLSVRVDFLAHGVVQREGRVTHSLRTVAHANTKATVDAIYRAGGAGLFTTDPAAFRAGLEAVMVAEDISPLPALDAVLDFPWRVGSRSRLVVLLSDRTYESTLEADRLQPRIRDVIAELHRKSVTLLSMAPDCAGFEELSSANGANWFPDGWSAFSDASLEKFVPMYGYAPRSIPADDVNPLFGQDAFI
jgi:hypothetical protein